MTLSLIDTATIMSTRLDPQHSQAYVDLIDKYDTWLFDCDGVLWRGDTVIEGIKEVLALLRKKSAQVHVTAQIMQPT